MLVTGIRLVNADFKRLIANKWSYAVVGMKLIVKRFYRLAEILNILAQHRFTKHGTTTIKMRLQNYSYLDKVVGLSHAAKQSRTVFDKYQP